jgi:SAM-dependent methyltransferase
MNTAPTDALVPYYKYMYADWEDSVTKQAQQLDALIKEVPGARKTLLDVSCGIGTQALGLAALGYEVTGIAMSEGELSVARSEAEKRALAMTFSCGEMRSASKGRAESFDVVISADNAVPHMLTDADILKAFMEFNAALKHGGVCLVSVRDYVNFNPDRNKIKIAPRAVHELASGRIVLFDVYRFDSDYYDLTTYIVRDSGEKPPETMVQRSRYYCVTCGRLEALLRRAGFINVHTVKDRFIQPVIIAGKP